MLDALSPPTPPIPPTQPEASTTATEPPADAPQTDLVGSWQAKAGDSSIDLTIGDDSSYSWKVTQSGKPPLEIKGELTATSDMLVLENEDQGSIAGRVKSVSADEWQFAVSGGPPSDPGLSFQRVQ